MEYNDDPPMANSPRVADDEPPMGYDEPPPAYDDPPISGAWYKAPNAMVGIKSGDADKWHPVLWTGFDRSDWGTGVLRVVPRTSKKKRLPSHEAAHELTCAIDRVGAFMHRPVRIDAANLYELHRTGKYSCVEPDYGIVEAALEHLHRRSMS
jgi:hypothetical protein